MVVTGNETGDPNRSIDVLEQHLLSFLPAIEALYEKEREQDPGLMGSLDVNMTIEPDGVVSDLRFPRRRVSSEHLATAAFDHMRAWTFPPAEQRVQFRYTLLFVPSGIDQASIMVWENRLGNRAIVEEVEEHRVASVAATPPAPPKEPTPPVTEPVESRRRSPSAVVPSERPHEHSETPPAIVTGWYRVTSATALRAAPRSSSEVITRLNRGTRVQVVGAAGGDWLEVRSVRGRAPGFLYRGDAQLEEEGRTGRRW
jgi:hypothetical protein